MTNTEFYNLCDNEEFTTYLEALCHLASDYIPKIRRQFAEKAVEMYHNETVRKLVLAYSEELKDLQRRRYDDFRWIAKDPSSDFSLNDWCLNKAKSYADAIWFLFGIEK